MSAELGPINPTDRCVTGAVRTGVAGLVAAIGFLAGCSQRQHGSPARDSSATRTMTPAPAPVTSAEWRIIPGRSADFITAESNEKDLAQHYGARMVESQRIDIGEGETAPGTVLFPSDSGRRLEIIWQDSVTRARPARLILRGDSTRWSLNGGVSLGTSLPELERLNGRPFQLAGFGWDYSGVVYDWSRGRLDSLLPGVKVYLDPGPKAYESAAYKQVLGDTEYSSDLPAMHQLSPKVYQIFVDFESPRP
jgi:hypothetical protein